MTWAGPLLNLVIDGPRSSIESALKIATATWNAVTLEDAGLSPGAIKEVRQQLATLPPPGPQLFGEVVSALIESRRTEFAEANWTVGKCEIRGQGAKSRIYLEAQAIPSRG
jgi:hypothetical protein